MKNITQAKLNKKLLLAFCLVMMLLSNAPVASAISGSEFNAGRIIDDSVFYDSQTMSVTDIQSFLNAKGPSCDTNGTQTISYRYNSSTRRVAVDPDPYVTTSRALYTYRRHLHKKFFSSTPDSTYPNPPTPYQPSLEAPNPSGIPDAENSWYTTNTHMVCLKNYYENTITHETNYATGNIPSGSKNSAQIIYDASQKYGINPRVFLVLLQKEQSLLTDDWPWPIQYRAATGYGCPDTAACSSSYYGFYNQIDSSAWQYKYYKDNAADYGYRAGRYNRIQYNPNPACGDSQVFIENQATAGLYIYTPYQPNAAALAAPEGAEVDCGAYGNLNFWRKFNDWFGKTVFITPIKWEPAITSQAPGKINAFARGTDNRLWQTWLDNTGWQIKWNYIDGSSSTSSAPSAISWGDGHMDVFETRNGSLWHSWYSANGGWRTWQPIGRPDNVWLGGTPAAVSQTAGKINVFARGSDGRLWQNWFDSTGWQTKWNYIDGPSSNSSSPTAVSWGDGHMDVFETRGGSLWHSWYSADSTGWRGWQPIGRPDQVSLNGSSAVVSQKLGKINVFARGSDGRLWQNWFDSTGWQTKWNYIDGPSSNSSSPTAVSWGDGHMDVFETRGGSLWHSWYSADSTGWRGWQPIGRP